MKLKIAHSIHTGMYVATEDLDIILTHDNGIRDEDTLADMVKAYNAIYGEETELTGDVLVGIVEKIREKEKAQPLFLSTILDMLDQ